MSGKSHVDTTLVIRARDEASKAVSAIESALTDLLGVQKEVAGNSKTTGQGITQLIGVLANLDKAYTSIRGSAATGAAAFERQGAAIAANKAQLTALQQQSQGAARAADQLRVALVDAVMNGVDATPLRNQIGEVGAEMRRLDSEAKKLQRTIEQQESGFTRSASTLGDIERQTRLVGAVEAFARQEADEFTASLSKQNAVAEKNAQVLRDIDRATNATSGKSAADSGAVFQQQGLTAFEKQIAATEAATRAEKQRADAVELTNNALRARGRIEGNGGTAGKASDTAFAQQLREEEEAAQGAAAAEKELVDAATRLRAALNPMAAIQDKLNRELEEADRLYKAGKISATELAGAQNLLKASADRSAQSLGQQSAGGGKPTLFGLKPYEVQNLGYQVNDVVTQLASGTSLAQTLGQQGGQLIQIFPRVGASIFAAFSNPAVLAFAATVGAVVIALKEAGDEAERVRGFLTLLTASADGGKYGAAELNKASEALDAYGLSAEDAVKVVRTFVQEGIEPTRVVQFGKAAQDLADVLGISVVDAAKQLSTGLTGSFADVQKLDDATQSLTAAQLDEIKQLYELGKADEARGRAASLLFAKLQDAADKSRGSWAQATRELSAAWQEFTSYLGDLAPIQGVTESLAKLAGVARTVIRSLRDTGDAAGTAEAIARVQGQIAKLEQQIAADPSNRALKSSLIDRKSALVALNEQYKKLGGTVADVAAAETAAAAGGTRDTLAQSTERQAKANQRITDEIRRQRVEARKVTSEVDIQAKLAQKRRDALTEIQSKEPNASAAAQAQFAAAAVDRERIRLNKELSDYQDRQTKAAKEYMTVQQQTIRLLKGVEGFQAKAKFDRNAFRLGYGSDTMTAADGTVSRVTPSSRTDEAGAMRDLERRIGEFVNVIKGQIGSERFADFSSSQQSALTSIAYNYGSLPKRILDAVKTGTSEQIAAAVRGLKGDNGGINAGRREREAVLLGAPNLAVEQGGEEARQKVADDLLKTQTAFNERIDQENAKRSQTAAALREQAGLIGNALLLKQREQAISEAVADKERELEAINAQRRVEGKEEIKLTDEQRKAVIATTGAYFDLAHARDTALNDRTAVDQPVNELIALRDSLLQQIADYQQRGQVGLANGLEVQLRKVNAQLQQATQSALTFYQALAGDPVKLAALGLTKDALDAIILKLQTAQANSIQWGYVLGVSAQQIAQTFATTATAAIDRFAQAIAAGESATTALKDAFLSFASDFLRQIAQMIVQQIAYNAAVTILRAVGVATGGVPVAHGGGIIGSTMGRSRSVNPALFANAARYHTGGVAGLRPNEVPAILERGEEVLTRDDPRHRSNGGVGGGGGDVSVKNVVVYDAAAALEMGLSDKRGEKVFFAFPRANRSAINSSLA